MNTTFEQIVSSNGNVNFNELLPMAMKERSSPAIKDSPKCLLLAIDVQRDFDEGGSLGVPGATADIERINHFIYDNMDGISRIMCSVDTHTAHQIFHPCWWENSNGDNPAPYTIITYDDVKAGRWRPIIGNPRFSIQYLQELEKTGKKQLCIWPYHCLCETDGHKLVESFSTMVHFHSVARKTEPIMIRKGTDPYSEMYGIIKPEFSLNNIVNTPVLNAIENFDSIFIVGEAKSHCVLESIRQITEHFKDRPDVTQKIVILEDCMSSIPGYEKETEKAFTDFKKKFGVKFSKSTEIHLQ